MYDFFYDEFHFISKYGGLLINDYRISSTIYIYSYNLTNNSVFNSEIIYFHSINYYRKS
jgi:hypothetical protein